MAKNKGFSGMNFEQIMMQQASRAVESPVYCSLCGLDIKSPSRNSSGGPNGDWKRNIDWELHNKVHTKCASEYQR